MSAPQTIAQLVERFHRSRDTYLTNAPDYSFRIGGARKFFLEIKKGEK